MDSEELVQFYSTHIVDNVDLTQKYSRIKHLRHKPYTTLIVGERGVGKTTLAKDIASKIISIHNIERTMSFTNNIGYDFRKLFEEQEKSSSKPILIIFDECFTSNEMNDDKNIRIITAYARLLKIFSIIITQPQHMKMEPSLRINMDLVFVFKDDANRKKIYDYYFGMLPNFNIFNSIMSSLEEHECLVVDHFCDDSKLKEELLGRYKSNNIIV